MIKNFICILFLILAVFLISFGFYFNNFLIPLGIVIFFISFMFLTF